MALLGDSAHAMQPNLGQGGCMAIEDGYQLAVDLSEAVEKAETSGRPLDIEGILKVGSLSHQSVLFGCEAMGVLCQWRGTHERRDSECSWKSKTVAAACSLFSYEGKVANEHIEWLVCQRQKLFLLTCMACSC